MVVGILIEISHQNVDKIFDYHVPDILVPEIKVGIRVEVPFGRQTLEGFVLEIKDRSDCDNLRDVISIVDNDIVLNEELLSLGKRMHRELLSTLISCYQVMLPKALKAKHGVNVSKKYDIFYRMNKDFSCKINATQQKIIDLFKDNELVSRSDLVKISASSLKTLIKNGVLIEEKHEHYRMQYTFGDSSKKELTKEQEKVFLSVEVNNGALILGEDDSEVSQKNPYIKGSELGIEQKGTMKFYDGLVEAKVGITGEVNEVAEGHYVFVDHDDQTGNQKVYLVGLMKFKI